MESDRSYLGRSGDKLVEGNRGGDAALSTQKSAEAILAGEKSRPRDVNREGRRGHNREGPNIGSADHSGIWAWGRWQPSLPSEEGAFGQE